MNKKVYVAMSGGVDSSVAAVLLKERGYDVTGIFMKFWSPDTAGDSPRSGTVPAYCLWREEREDAVRVAAQLGIPLLTWDFTAEYEKKVVAYMLEAYGAGITPNPDILCNKEIKFGLFFDQAMKEGADLVATGHYARVAGANPKSEITNNETMKQCNNFQLLQAVDKNKDQSYFLYLLEQRHLEKTLFPIGEFKKPEVRQIAKKFNLPTATKKDSQGICFIGPIKLRQFLKEHIKPKKGPILNCRTRDAERDLRRTQIALSSSRTGGTQQLSSSVKRKSLSVEPSGCTVLGEHDGVYYYTIGQRHGLDIKTGGGPYFVVGKDIEKNIIYVDGEADLYSDQATVSNIHWIGAEPKMPSKLDVKIRYRSESVPATLSQLPATNYHILFSKPVRAITPGQAAVFYDGEIVLGGGVIQENALLI